MRIRTLLLGALVAASFAFQPEAQASLSHSKPGDWPPNGNAHAGDGPGAGGGGGGNQNQNNGGGSNGFGGSFFGGGFAGGFGGGFGGGGGSGGNGSGGPRTGNHSDGPAGLGDGWQQAFDDDGKFHDDSKSDGPGDDFDDGSHPGDGGDGDSHDGPHDWIGGPDADGPYRPTIGGDDGIPNPWHDPQDGNGPGVTQSVALEDPVNVPEPSSLAVLTTALLGMAASRRRKNRARAK